MPVIRTPDQRIRVFISSTLQELAEERQVIKEAIDRLRLIPVMFELGARPYPPRDLYRAYLEQSHIFIGIYWKSYGWVAPGMTISGLEDEYRLSEGKPRLIYLKQTDEDRQPELDRMIREIQQADISYKKFSTLAELKELVEIDLALLLSERFEAGFPQEEGEFSIVRKYNIPTPRTPLIGRETECREIIDRLQANGQVTITGPGGTGKSRLALEIAHQIKNGYPDGAYFVNLESLKEPEAVISTVAHTIGMFDNGRMPVFNLLARYLEDKKALLLLDNFEHLLDAAKDISELQQECPDIQILITSRTPLRLRGEQIYPLEPLPHPDFVTIHSPDQLLAYPAVELFIQRARALSPGLAMTDDSIKAVAEICRRLDGLPLAIELAASHTKYLSPTALAQRMDHVLDLLTRSPMDSPNRQRTMRSTISWSSELLDEASRKFFHKLGYFQGSWTLEAADEIAHEDPQGLTGILEHIEKLIDFGLVKPILTQGQDEDPRFILMQTIREFALESLSAEGLLEAIANRHAAYFCRLAEEAERYFWTPQAQVWILRLEKDLPDFRQAYQWALKTQDTEKQWILTGCLAQVMTALGMGTESGQMITTTNLWSDAGKKLPLPLRARTYYYGGVQEFFSGKFKDSWDKLTEAVKCYRATGDQVFIARTLAFQGLTGITLRKLDSVDLFREAIETGTRSDDRFSVIIASTFMSETMMMMGKMDEAFTLIANAEELARQTGDYLLIASMLITKGNLGIVTGDRESSEKAYSECIIKHQFFSQMTLEGWSRLGLAYWHLTDFNIEEVKPEIGTIIELGRKSGDLALQVGGIYAMAGYLALADHVKPSIRLQGAAERICNESGYNLWSATVKLKDWVESQVREELPEQEYRQYFEEGKKLAIAEIFEEIREFL